MRIIPIEHALNKALAENLYDVNGRILLKEGTVLTDNHLAKIKLNGLLSVYIQDEYSSNKLKPPFPTELKISIMSELKSAFKEIRKTKLPGGGNHKLVSGHLTKIRELVDHIMYELPNDRKHYINFVDIKSIETYTYAHSVNTAVLSLLLAYDLGIDVNRHHDIFLGALLGDIGMSFIDESLFLKNGKLDVKEFIKIKEHSKLGYDFIKDFHFANAYIKVIVLQHHEKIDGSGYPNSYRGDEINPLAKIVSVADVYDAMTSDRVYARAVSPSEAIEYIMGASGRHFDEDVTKKFIKKVMPYPAGTLVTLNINKIALVEKINLNFPLRPVIRLINENKKLELSEVNLMDERTLMIDKVFYGNP